MADLRLSLNDPLRSLARSLAHVCSRRKRSLYTGQTGRNLATR